MTLRQTLAKPRPALPVEALSPAGLQCPRFEFAEEANMAGTRKVIDCRSFPAEKPCTIAISGSEEEVLDLAVFHAISVHGHANTPELRGQIRTLLREEGAAAEAA
jgi:hypothetical protein